MKKGIIKTLLSAALVCAMAITASAHYYFPISGDKAIETMPEITVYGKEDAKCPGYGIWGLDIDTLLMPNTCPTCKKGTAVYYVENGNVYSFCTSCKKTVIVYEAPKKDAETGKPAVCKCGEVCKCKVICPTDKVEVTCGKVCAKCSKTIVCADDCKTCVKPVKPPVAKIPFIVYACEGVTISESGTLGKAYYGETKHISITCKKNYRIVDVIVNGYSYGDIDEFDVEVYGGTSIKVICEKYDASVKYNVKATSNGGGNITLYVNGSVQKGTSYKAKYTDNLTFTFKPTKNCKLVDVKINGISIGAKTSYSLSKIRGDVDIQVTFRWNNPYTDVDSVHLNAVEYVTTNGIMKSPNTYFNTDLFCGDWAISEKTFVCALAEMADTDNELNGINDRVEWAKENGLVGNEKITVTLTAKKACEIIDTFLSVICEKDGITFKGYDTAKTAEENVLSLGLMTSSDINDDVKVTRYDTAEMIMKIALLETK